MLYHTCMNEFIRYTIEKSGKTKADIARAMGVTPQAVGSLIATDEPRPSTLVKLLTALDWPLSDIELLSLGEVYEIDAVV